MKFLLSSVIVLASLPSHLSVFVLSEHLAQLQQAVLKIIDIKSAEPVSEGEEYGPSSPLSPTAVNRRPRIRTSSMSSADTTLSESSDRVTNHLSSIV